MIIDPVSLVRIEKDKFDPFSLFRKEKIYYLFSIHLSIYRN